MRLYCMNTENPNDQRLIDKELCREREQEWRQKANALPEGDERDAHLAIADSYALLGRLLENLPGWGSG